ncbi:helix-turn-helix domain-containing protein [Actinokineospora sp. 24-640]
MGVVMRPDLEVPVARRLLAYQLVRLCADAELRHVDLADRLGVSRASVTQMLMGKNLPSRATLEIIVQRCGFPEKVPGLVAVLDAARSRRYAEPLPAGQHRDGELAIGLEAIADSITLFDPDIVPAVLQTPDYTHAVLTARKQSKPELDVDGHRELIHRRHGILTASTVTITWITEQRALHNPTVPAAVMADQLRHLQAVSTGKTISIHVLLEDSPPPPIGAFTLIRVGDWITAHQQTAWSTHYYDTPEALAEYAHLMDYLLDLSHNRHNSRSILNRAADLATEDAASAHGGTILPFSRTPDGV